MFRKTLLTFMVCGFFASNVVAQEAETPVKDEPLSLQQLLERVKEGRVTDNSANKKRERQFINERNKRKSMLDNVNRKIGVEEARSERLEATFNANELQLAELEGLLNERLGVFGELFGVVRQVSGETSAQVGSSIISGEITGRLPALDELAKSKGLPKIKELEGLWYELQREMVAGSEVVSFNANVINLDGESENCLVTRVGLYNAICDGKYLEYIGSKGQYAFLGKQPEGRYVSSAKKLSKADVGDVVKFGVDPTGPVGGSLLANLIQNPSLMERVNQGREVGYIIIFVGLIGIAIAFWKLYTLYTMGVAVAKQAKSKTHDKSNPLGRVLAVGEEHMNKDIETLELRLAEAIMAERPSIERGIPVVKIISVVAPLAGLLGTVTGMIVTFQQITLFGTGDPKIMAGGISQALVTTVLGLVVAIPTTLLHSFANSSARGIINVLEEQSTGIVAEHSDSK